MNHTRVITTYSGGVKDGPESKEFKELREQEEISKAKEVERDGLKNTYLGGVNKKIDMYEGPEVEIIKTIKEEKPMTKKPDNKFPSKKKK